MGGRMRHADGPVDPRRKRTSQIGLEIPAFDYSTMLSEEVRKRFLALRKRRRERV